MYRSEEEGGLDAALLLRVQIGRRLVQKDDVCVLEDGAGDRDALPLAAGQRGAVLAEHGVVAIREGEGEVVAACHACDPED